MMVRKLGSLERHYDATRSSQRRRMRKKKVVVHVTPCEERMKVEPGPTWP